MEILLQLLNDGFTITQTFPCAVIDICIFESSQTNYIGIFQTDKYDMTQYHEFEYGDDREISERHIQADYPATQEGLRSALKDVLDIYTPHLTNR